MEVISCTSEHSQSGREPALLNSWARASSLQARWSVPGPGLATGPTQPGAESRVLTSAQSRARLKWGYFRSLPTMFKGSEPMDYPLPHQL